MSTEERGQGSGIGDEGRAMAQCPTGAAEGTSEADGRSEKCRRGIRSKIASVSAERVRSRIGWETGRRAVKEPGLRKTGQNGHNTRIIGGF